MWVVIWSTFLGCLCKLMAYSRREMLAKRRQSGSMTVTADDAESAVDVPTGKERRSSPAVSCHHHCPWTTHLVPAATASSLVAAAASRRHLHAAGRSATAMCPVRTSSPATRRLMRVSNFGRFLTSNDLYAD